MKSEKKKPAGQIPIGGIITEAGSSARFMTGNWKAQRPVVDESKCIHCMACVHFCPENCILVKDDKRGEFDLDYCKGCGICANQCPVKCIKMMPESQFEEK